MLGDIERNPHAEFFRSTIWIASQTRSLPDPRLLVRGTSWLNPYRCLGFTCFERKLMSWKVMPCAQSVWIKRAV
ncbi:hypothetical protein [Bradyrhizobium cajani]|uniref:hypothetical protein n=1 Tax=Bradyrhizobium cajani TaxID=1928661 RepID=UPI00142EBDE2|nr:hypothetical protein [Bradyrhizobium cajani]MCP3368685.1 hypothetical protein [Bradyrhizobium cajani]